MTHPYLERYSDRDYAEEDSDGCNTSVMVGIAVEVVEVAVRDWTAIVVAPVEIGE